MKSKPKQTEQRDWPDARSVQVVNLFIDALRARVDGNVRRAKIDLQELNALRSGLTVAVGPTTEEAAS